MDFLIDLIFQGVNRYFVLLFENKEDRKVHIRYYLPWVEIKGYNVLIDGSARQQTHEKIYYSSKNCNKLREWLSNWLFARL